ncbi:hypothetical protein KMZ32_09605 [Phycicoccus sp. MAQZ13P-2]|uniref:hypothetical protein n=1 Tax=Phycicoccus mangrovi TaxID=2840470 RepID=UPI001BFFFD18|nr:hypothetical protein [Phycicoccus mangrovi]MBT9255735.1 hypothetical protein [Phycicoccus mangrovi]MBT9274329.1 hypothetical protein [Phycicoccus mangrovi]
MANAREWTDEDQSLLYTCHLAADLFAGRPLRPAPVTTTFPPQFAHDECFLAGGRFVLNVFDSPGDGTYQHDSSFFLATGRGGLAMTAGYAAGRAYTNSRRRKRAAADARPRWLPRYVGVMTVSDRGIYLRTPQDFIPWDWGFVQSCEVVGFNQVVLAAPATDGRLAHWLLQSPYAELFFLLWAHARYPGHPQLVDDRWLPPSWTRWASDLGKRPPLVRPPAHPEALG